MRFLNIILHLGQLFFHLAHFSLKFHKLLSCSRICLLFIGKFELKFLNFYVSFRHSILLIIDIFSENFKHFLLLNNNFVFLLNCGFQFDNLTLESGLLPNFFVFLSWQNIDLIFHLSRSSMSVLYFVLNLAQLSFSGGRLRRDLLTVHFCLFEFSTKFFLQI